MSEVPTPQPDSPPGGPSRSAPARPWRHPILFPLPGRRLPLRLHPGRVHALVEGLPAGVRDPDFEKILGEIDGRPPYGGNRVQVFTGGGEAFAAMHTAIEAAEREILLESYIFTDDATGYRVRNALVAAARRGIQVRVVVDAVGSAATRRSFWTDLEEQGVQVRQFHPLSPPLFRHPFRDHRKILVVDRSIAFTGGMNIADEYGSSWFSRNGSTWRDSHVEVRGPAAWELTVVFAEAWEQSGGEPFEIGPLRDEPAKSGSRVLVLESSPNRGHAESAAVFAAIIAAARRSVWITNAYFAPKRTAVESLGRAAERGVDVRLLLPGRSDVPVVRHAGHGFFTDLLRRGVKIFEYQASMLHAKSLVVDGYVSMVGSTNLDFRSFTFNGECNLVVLDEQVAAELEGAFTADLAEAAAIEPGRWYRRHLSHRVLDWLARRLSPLL